ncbi:IS66-like element accessory protein TnpA [Teichococcus vastitatis]|uniref:IS66-like element accessory protein TnpA n=1 Tax=Teichococcus vastitatis TaxID=2307076 RepID=UPI000E75A255|nr:transposase [Pseudoroseomonas vastitatis]
MAGMLNGAGAGTGAGTVAMERVEIVTRGERRRIYSPEMKARLLMETAAPGTRVLEVAQRHGISPSLLHRWRREAEGRPARRVVRQASPFVPLLVDASPETGPQNTAAPAESGMGATIEVVLRNGRVLRAFGTVDAVVVARLATALEG